MSYVCQCDDPTDITFAVSSLSQHLEAPTTSHMHAVTPCVPLPNGTKELKLVIGGKHVE